MLAAARRWDRPSPRQGCWHAVCDDLDEGVASLSSLSCLPCSSCSPVLVTAEQLVVHQLSCGVLQPGVVGEPDCWFT